MKRTLLILTAVALLLIVLVVGLLLGLASALRAPRSANQSLEDYLAQNWSVFRLRTWDAQTGTLELDYPLRFTFNQMEKYGASVEELRDLPVGNLETVSAMKAAAREATGVTVRSVTVYGLTTDGQIAYTINSDGAVSACWDGT